MLERLPAREEPIRVPKELAGEPGLFVVDATWGTVNPVQLGKGVATIAELELVEHLERGLRLVDTRSPDSFRQGTIPGAINIPRREIARRVDELDPEAPTAFFCNGPQCPATPSTIRELLGLGYPPEVILYYRGGTHDWVTLGFPIVPGT